MSWNHGWKHGESPQEIRTREYNVWRTMRQRCNSVTHENYQEYGGRGIKICSRWDEYACFLADMGRCPEGMSIDRIDNDKDYEPGNCRWATRSQQRVNQRRVPLYTINGKTMNLSGWANSIGVSRCSVFSRLKRGWSMEDAISIPFGSIVNKRGQNGQYLKKTP